MGSWTPGKDERVCLNTRWAELWKTPGGLTTSRSRLSLGQGLPELAQQRHLLAGALPAGRGPPSAQGAQRVSHSGLGPRLPQLSGQ